jgi:hypothetical protein
MEKSLVSYDTVPPIGPFQASNATAAIRIVVLRMPHGPPSLIVDGDVCCSDKRSLSRGGSARSRSAGIL